MIDEKQALQRVKTHLEQSSATKLATISHAGSQIFHAAQLIARAFSTGNKVLICGNGGSAADCQHMAAEFVSRLTKDFDRQGLPALALTTDTSFITAYGNDCGFDGIFERQVSAFGKRDDVLIAISTSGNSRNVIRAVNMARTLSLQSIALIGQCGTLSELCDVTIAVPASSTQIIQETHLAIEHIVCDLVERILFHKGE